MNFNDARSLPQKAQEDLRLKAVSAVLQGRSQVEVARLFGVSNVAVSNWMKKYREGGFEALKMSKPRGRGSQEQMLLTASQQKLIKELIESNCPDQLMLPGFLWTRESVRQLIKDRCGVPLAIRTVGDYLKRWGFTFQKPARIAVEQNPIDVVYWREIKFPKIASKAARQKARIMWADEMGIRSDHTSGRGYSPKGKTPKIGVSGNRFKTNVISAIGNGGHMQFKVFNKRFTTDVFIDFLSRLIKDKQDKIFLIVDQHPVHKAKKVQHWLEQHERQIELFFLPPYCPELNPDEYLNQYVKTSNSKKRSSTLSELVSNLGSTLRSLQKTPGKVANLFQAKDVQYAGVGY